MCEADVSSELDSNHGVTVFLHNDAYHCGFENMAFGSQCSVPVLTCELVSW